jgi:hypothetical protein
MDRVDAVRVEFDLYNDEQEIHHTVNFSLSPDDPLVTLLLEAHEKWLNDQVAASPSTEGPFF